MKFETQTHYQRFMLGIICGLLPIACLLFGMLGQFRGINPPWLVQFDLGYIFRKQQYVHDRGVVPMQFLSIHLQGV